MAFYTEHIHIDGSLNVDGSIFQWNSLFVGGGAPDGGVSQAYVDGSLALKAPISSPDLTGLTRITGPTQDADYTVLKLNHRAGTVKSGTVIEIGADYETAHSKLIGYSNPNQTVSSQFAIQTYNGSWNLGLYQDEAGKIGLEGNTAPTYQLSLSNTVGGKILLYDGVTTLYGFGIQSNLMQIFAATATDRVGVGYGSSASFTETLTIKGANVGIGNTSPAAKLYVDGSAKLTSNVTCQDYVQVLNTSGTEGFKIVWNNTEKTVDTIIN